GRSGYLLGTDQLGRDILSRIIYGARISLLVGFTGILIAGSLGALLAMIAGYFGRSADLIIMRVTESFMAFPVVLLAIILATTRGASFLNVIIVVSLMVWPLFARQVRGEVLAVRERAFVTYANAIGVPSR